MSGAETETAPAVETDADIQCQDHSKQAQNKLSLSDTQEILAFARQLHALGPRVLAEFLIDLCEGEDLATTLEAYAELTPEILIDALETANALMEDE